jgi:hypothetical protein
MIRSSGRISIKTDEGLFSLVIFPVQNKLKLNLLFGWLLLWSLCGMIFIANFINYSKGPQFAEMEYVKVQREIQDPKEKEKAIANIRQKLEKNQQQRVILAIIIAFWAYYEFKVGRAYLFRRYGKEKLWMKDGKIFYKRQINKRGKLKSFDAEFVKEFDVVEYNKHDFFQNVSRSFWNLAGDTISFDYHSKTMRFGIQLDEREAEELTVKLNKGLKRMQKESVKTSD